MEILGSVHAAGKNAAGPREALRWSREVSVEEESRCEGQRGRPDPVAGAERPNLDQGTSPDVHRQSLGSGSCGLPELWQRTWRGTRSGPQPRIAGGALRGQRGRADEPLPTHRAALG